MWIIDALYIVVSLLVASMLVWSDALWPALFVLATGAALGLDRWRGRDLPRWLLPVLLTSISGGMFTTATVVHQVPTTLAAPIIASCLALMIAPSILWRGRHQVVIFTAALTLTMMLWFGIHSADPEEAYPIVHGALWMMALWPFILFFSSNRYLVPVYLCGPLVMAACAHVLLTIEGVASVAHWREVTANIPASLLSGTVAAQVLLVIAVALPLSMEAHYRWRFLAMLGGVIVLSAMSMVFIVLNGYLSWDSAATTVSLIGSLILAIGIAGILASVHRPGLFAGLALRVLGFACMASAVQIAVLVPQDAVTIMAIAQALASAVAGWILVTVIGLAVFFAPEVKRVRLNTQRIHRRMAEAQQRMSSSLIGFAGDVRNSIRSDVAMMSDPWRIVPVVLFIAAWPALFALNSGLWALLAFFPAYFSASLAYRQQFLWLFVYVAMVLLTTLSYGHSWYVAPVFLTLALVVAWPFCRWPQLDPAFAYPSAVVLLAPLWLHTAPIDPTQIILPAVLVVLLANGLRRGPMRWLLLAATVGITVWWLNAWVVARDPFTTIILEETRVLEQFYVVMMGVPLMLLMLMLLWITRLRGGIWWQSLQGMRLVLVLCSLLLISLWVLGWREAWWQGTGALAILILMRRDFTNQIALARASSFRHPLTAALALCLVVLACGLASAMRLFPASVESLSNMRVQQPGMMGPIYLQALRELFACLLAVPIILVWQILAQHGDRMTAVVTSSVVRVRQAAPEGMATLIKRRARLITHVTRDSFAGIP
ncbi:MAG: hypothetical protein EA401_02080, partial [Planctomycetota bacterium]